MANSLKRLSSISLVLVFIMLGLFPKGVWAAGSATISVEKSANSVTSGSTMEIRFYVTNSGANLSGLEFDVGLSKLTLSSYSSSGSGFTFFNALTSGNSAGSTAFHVVAANDPAKTPGKHYIGKAVVKAGSSTGTGSVTLSNAAISDSNEDPMTSSVQGTTVTVAAPASPSPTPTPTPTPTETANTSNPTTSPNPDNVVTVPDSDKKNPGSKEVKEQDLADAFNETETNPTDNPKALEDEKNKTTMFRIAGGLLLLALLIISAVLLQKHRIKAREAKHHGLNNAVVTSENPPAQPVSPNGTNEASTNKSEGNGPTIITPGQS